MADIQRVLFESDTEYVTITVPDTRAKAHDKAKPSKRDLHILLLKSYYESAFSADDWAIERGISILRIRPRVSEMNKAGMLHRVGYGLTVDGNDQDKFTLFPYIRNRMQLLACKYGIDRAAVETLGKFNLLANPDLNHKAASGS